MVMCKYFLRGSCRFGESCKNEHAYNAETAANMRKKGDIDINVLIKSVSNDMDKAEKGNQWPLSCYGPFQAKPCFPAFEDKCFEEIRLGMYEAEKSGTVEQYKQQLTQLLHEARMKMRSLQNPTAEATHVLQELYNANSPETSNAFAANTNAFGNSPIQQSNSVFNNTAGAAKSIFNNQPAPSYSFAAPENKSIFGNAAPPNTNSIFAQANQQSFATGGGIFGGNQIQQQPQQQSQQFPASNIFKSANNSIFGAQQSTTNPSQFGGVQPAQSSSNIFMQNNQPPNPFKQNIQAATAGQSPFGQLPFGASNPTPSTFAPNQTQSTFAPNQTQSTFAPNQIQPTSTFAPNPTQPPFAIANQSPFAATFTPNPNQTSFAPTPQNQSVFPQSQPSFNANQSPFSATAAPVNQSPFAATAAPVNKSPFAATAAPVNQSPFASNTSIQTPFGTNPSPFAAQQGTITENRSIFAQQTQQNSQASASDHSRSIFGSTQLTIIAPVARQDDPTIYSKLETLTENDVKSFEANTFEFGKIPDKPPTLQMCT